MMKKKILKVHTNPTRGPTVISRMLISLKMTHMTLVRMFSEFWWVRFFFFFFFFFFFLQRHKKTFFFFCRYKKKIDDNVLSLKKRSTIMKILFKRIYIRYRYILVHIYIYTRYIYIYIQIDSLNDGVVSVGFNINMSLFACMVLATSK